jgi:hypothetical protein
VRSVGRSYILHKEALGRSAQMAATERTELPLRLSVLPDGAVSLSLQMPPPLPPAPSESGVAHAAASTARRFLEWEVRHLIEHKPAGLLEARLVPAPQMAVISPGDEAVQCPAEGPPFQVVLTINRPKLSPYHSEHGLRLRLLFNADYPHTPPEVTFLQIVHHFFVDGDNGLPDLFYEMLGELVEADAVERAAALEHSAGRSLAPAEGAAAAARGGAAEAAEALGSGGEIGEIAALRVQISNIGAEAVTLSEAGRAEEAVAALRLKKKLEARRAQIATRPKRERGPGATLGWSAGAGRGSGWFGGSAGSDGAGGAVSDVCQPCEGEAGSDAAGGHAGSTAGGGVEWPAALAALNPAALIFSIRATLHLIHFVLQARPTSLRPGIDTPAHKPPDIKCYKGRR